jgi:flagellar protein FlbD
MILVSRLGGQPMMVNPDLIETIETTPDTVLTLFSGNKLIVRDSMETIQERIIEFKRRIYGPPPVTP